MVVASGFLPTPPHGDWVNGKLSADAVGHVPVVRRFVQRLLVF
jgi:hypothetical protein